MKILITSTPATGHLNPLLAIGRFLIAEGHEVVGLSGSAFREKTVPLALLPEGNLYRDYALASLNNAGRAWRIACVSESIAGMEAMALADAAVIVLAKAVKVAGLRQLTEADGLPALPSVDFVLWRRHVGAFPAADHLAAHIERNVGVSRG